MVSFMRKIVEGKVSNANQGEERKRESNPEDVRNTTIVHPLEVS